MAPARPTVTTFQAQIGALTGPHLLANRGCAVQPLVEITCLSAQAAKIGRSKSRISHVDGLVSTPAGTKQDTQSFFFSFLFNPFKRNLFQHCLQTSFGADIWEQREECRKKKKKANQTPWPIADFSLEKPRLWLVLCTVKSIRTLGCPPEPWGSRLDYPGTGRRHSSLQVPRRGLDRCSTAKLHPETFFFF